MATTPPGDHGGTSGVPAWSSVPGFPGWQILGSQAAVPGIAVPPQPPFPGYANVHQPQPPVVLPQQAAAGVTQAAAATSFCLQCMFLLQCRTRKVLGCQRDFTKYINLQVRLPVALPALILSCSCL